jgi:hypothetical protein
LIFQVQDVKNNILIGWYALTADCIREGLRVVPLRDQYFYTLQESFLLCHVQEIKG